MKEFRHISKHDMDTMVSNFIETIGNLSAILENGCPTEETMDACEIIGSRIRDNFVDGRLLLLFAKQIIDRANQRN